MSDERKKYPGDPVQNETEATGTSHFPSTHTGTEPGGGKQSPITDASGQSH